MNKRLESQNSAISKTVEFCDANSTVTAGDQPFIDTLTIVKNNLTLLDQLKQKQAMVLTGYRIDKQNKKVLCINDVLYLSSRIKSWAAVAHRPEVYEAVNYTEAELLGLKDAIFIAAAENIILAATDNLANLASYSVTQDNIDDAQDHRDDYSTVVSMPKEKIDERASFTRQMTQVIRDTMNILRSRLDANALAYRASNPEFYNGYLASRKIDDAPSRARALQGKVIDMNNGSAVANVKIEVSSGDENKIVAAMRKSGMKGNYFFSSLEPGTYQITFSKLGYQQFTSTINIIDGERVELNAQLQVAA